MSCSIKLGNAGFPYPRTCQDCVLGPCKLGLARLPPRLPPHVEEASAQLAAAVAYPTDGLANKQQDDKQPTCCRHDAPCVDAYNCAAGCLRGGTKPMAEPELTRDELLDLLAEECAEVIVAVSKARRFGFGTMWPGYGRNDYAIAREVGDVLACIDALQYELPGGPLGVARRNKISKARAMKRIMLERTEKQGT